MAGHGKGAVFFALLGSTFLAIIKFVAFALSGSSAILSEAIHSLADSGNQGLLYLGIRRSNRPPDSRYHYGYGAERYLFALLAAVGIFVLGCGVTIYHGVHTLLTPSELSLSWLSFGVMGVSLVLELAVLVMAIRQLLREKGDQSAWEYIKTSSDPTLVAVLFEDSVAIFGVLVATSGILLSYYTGQPIYDAVSSIIIGVLLGIVAIWLGWRNRQLILGPAIARDLQDEIVAYLEAQPSVQTVRLVKTRVIAADRFSIAAEIDYDGRFLGRQHADWMAERKGALADDERRVELAADFGEMVVDSLGKEVDRMEAELFERFPRLRHVALESDWNPDD